MEGQRKEKRAKESMYERKSPHDDMLHYMIHCDPRWSRPLNHNHLPLTFGVEESISVQYRVEGIKRVRGSGLRPARAGMDHSFQSSETEGNVLTEKHFPHLPNSSHTHAHIRRTSLLPDVDPSCGGMFRWLLCECCVCVSLESREGDRERERREKR